MKHMNGYLTLDGNCREAMGFYQECFGGELSLLTVGQSPIAEHFSADQQDSILHSCLTNGSMTLMGTECSAENCVSASALPGHKPRPFVSLCIDCDSMAEIERLYGVFSEGGWVSCPLGKMFWGATFATVADKFGINWLLTYDG